MLKRTTLQFRGVMLLSLLLIFGNACKKKVETIAGFTYAVDAANFTKVTFTNASQNATSVTWDFGDGTPTSTELNPAHTFAKEGSYVVKITAVGEDNTDEVTQTIKIADTNAELTKIAGTVSKTWKLLRVPGKSGRYPLQVGPFDRSAIWWAMGKDNDDIAGRPCSMNDEFTFFRDGSYKFDDKGDFWVEGNWYAKPDNTCATASKATMVGPKGEDLSAWGSGTHKFAMDGDKLTLTGLGAWIGLFKIGTEVENKVPQPAVSYKITKLVDAAVDTLILESNYKFAATDANFGGYWRVVLVSYDNPADEPAIPAPLPKASFTSTNAGSAYTFTNTSSNGTSYAWDFGDGSTATSKDATHTYTTEGFFTIKMTATNSTGSASASKTIFISNTPLTEALLQGGSWKVRADANSVVVGPGMFDGSWYQVSKDQLTGAKTGADDWSCMTDDEFIFKAGGVYEYKGNGTVRNDGYMGSPNGCMAESALTGNGAAFGSGVHSYAFTAAAGANRALITLTNGAKGAAFLGFYKGYYGGENSDKAKAPNGGNATNIYQAMYAKNGGKEYLYISVDLSAKHDGSSSWSVVLVR